MKNRNVLGFLFILFGLVLLYISYDYFESANDFISKTVLTRGEIVGFKVQKSKGLRPDSFKEHYPIIKFRTIQGEEVKFISSLPYNPERHKIGDWIEIRYQPRNPQNAEIYSFYSLWSKFFAVFIAGFIFALIGAIAIYRYFNPKNNAS